MISNKIAQPNVYIFNLGTFVDVKNHKKSDLKQNTFLFVTIISVPVSQKGFKTHQISVEVDNFN